MFALNASGKILWNTPAEAGLYRAAGFCGSPDAGSMDGHLRAYEMISGKIIWGFRLHTDVSHHGRHPGTWRIVQLQRARDCKRDAVRELRLWRSEHGGECAAGILSR